MKNGSKWIALVLCLLLTLGATSALAADSYKVGVMQYVEHPALDAATQGFLDALKAKGLIAGENLTVDVQNASADQATLQLMCNQLVQNENDLLLGVATNAVQSLSAATSTIPILGTAVTDYVGANLIAANDAPGINVSGTTDMNPIDKQLDLLFQLVPEAKTIGICYTSNEPNSKIQADIAKADLEGRGYTVIVKTITAVGEVQQAVESMVGQVDAVYIPTDNVFASAMPVVASVAEPAKLPVIVGEESMCKSGALATVGLNYYNLGYQTGEMAARILLDGANPAEMPIETQDSADVSLNQTNASLIGITFPEEVVAKAVNVFWGEKTFKAE